MKNIEITTTQNVTIQYGLASVWERFLALSLDLLFLGGFLLLMIGLRAVLVSADYEMLFYFLLLPVILFYSLFFELFNNGQSPGKKILKLRVIRMDGEKADFLDYLMRWIFRGLDIYFSFGGVGTLSIVSSAYNQRLGDLLANTVVVNISKLDRMPIENLLKFNSRTQRDITYPQVIKMSENSMVIVKETLSKSQALDNSAHHEAVALLVRQMENELDLKATGDKTIFLQTLLKDYINLTR